MRIDGPTATDLSDLGRSQVGARGFKTALGAFGRERMAGLSRDNRSGIPSFYAVGHVRTVTAFVCSVQTLESILHLPPENPTEWR